MRVECSKQTQNSETKNRGAGVKHRGVCVCVWNVRNKPKTWKQKIVRDKIHLLQKVGKSKIKKFRVKLYTKIILRIRLITGVKRNTFNKR